MPPHSTPYPYAPRLALSLGPRWPPIVRTEFTAVATALVTLEGRLTSVTDRDVTVGLLIAAPCEGTNIVEPSFEDYQRVPVAFVEGRERGAEYNKSEIRFLYGPDWLNPPKCVGVFVDGVLHFYGKLEHAPAPPFDDEGKTKVLIRPSALVLYFKRAMKGCG